jgi:serine/threonine protein phosphatase 1
MKIYVIGDIHGQHKALVQCLERSNFDYENDTLISLGDIVDRGLESWECVDTLLKIKNLIAIRGNHDDWFNHFLTKGKHPAEWLQGGENTLKSYVKHAGRVIEVSSKMGTYVSSLTNYDIDPKHIEFFNNQIPFYITQNKCFVHGGFNRKESIYTQDPNNLWWDRDLWNVALSCSTGQKLKTVDGFDEIYIGHTPTIHWNEVGIDELGNKKLIKIINPMNEGGVWNMDTGAAYTGGRLSIMDTNTKELFQSDKI